MFVPKIEVLMLVAAVSGFQQHFHASPRGLPLAGKKPKTFDEWSARRWTSTSATTMKQRPTSSSGNTTSEISRNTTAIDVAAAVVRDRRLQFEAARDGNRLQQHDILRRNLGG